VGRVLHWLLSSPGAGRLCCRGVRCGYTGNSISLCNLLKKCVKIALGGVYAEEEKGAGFKVQLCAFVQKFIEKCLCFGAFNIADMRSVLCTTPTVMWADG